MERRHPKPHPLPRPLRPRLHQQLINRPAVPRRPGKKNEEEEEEDLEISQFLSDKEPSEIGTRKIFPFV